MSEDGIFGLGILPLGKRLRRRLSEEQGRDGAEGREEDVMKKLEDNLNKNLKAFDTAIENTDCSLCKELLRKIRGLPLPDQVKAVPELRRFATVAEDGGDLEAELKNMPALRGVMDGG